METIFVQLLDYVANPSIMMKNSKILEILIRQINDINYVNLEEIKAKLDKLSNDCYNIDVKIDEDLEQKLDKQVKFFNDRMEECLKKNYAGR